MHFDKSTATQPPGQEPACQQTSALIHVEQLAEILGCSSRHVRRLSDSHRIPRPIKLGSLTRWTRVEIDNWINSGCPDCRKGGK